MYMYIQLHVYVYCTQSKAILNCCGISEQLFSMYVTVCLCICVSPPLPPFSSVSSIHLRFNAFSTECHWDYLHIYDGDSVFSPKIGAFSLVP